MASPLDREPAPTARLVALTGSAMLFGVACFLPAFDAYLDQPIYGFSLLLKGAGGILAPLKGAPLHIGWYANPLLAWLWWMLFQGRGLERRGAWIVSLLAVAIAASSFFSMTHFEIPDAGPSFRTARLVRFGPGIFLWMGSILIAAAGQLYASHRADPNKNKEPAAF
jgi:hypothetical protein